MHRCIKATVGSIVVHGEKILLERRNHAPFYDHWCIPGGHIEYGESVEEAMKRELYEETGLSCASTRFFDYYTEYYPDLDWHAVALIFVVEPVLEGQSLERQEEEVQDLRWFLPDEVSDLPMAFEHGRIVSDYLALKTTKYSEKS